MRVQDARNINELRLAARRHLRHFVFEYLDGGAEDELTLRRNRRAFERWQRVPRTLVDTGKRDLSAVLFGRRAALPLVAAPTGYNRMYRRDIDVALARAVQEVNDACQSTSPDGGRVWMQLYMLRDRAVAATLMRNAAQAGCDALVLTTDAVHSAIGNERSGRFVRRSY